MATSAAPVTPTKIIALLAFARDDEGELRPAIEPRECQSEAQAKQLALMLRSSEQYAGVIAWCRVADLINGEFDEPVEIYRWGDIPEME